ncbi:MAG: LLM class flavin-dependent oxidoreductase, partial [Pseudomonadales bacterium]
REEFEALGVPFERRGARFDDYVVAMKKVWSGEVVEHESDFIRWSGFKSYPLPVQKPHLPIITGGSAGRIFERTAKHANGWFAPMGDPKDLKPALEKLAAACDALGRDVAEIEITCMWPGQGGRDFVGALEDVGVSRVVVPVFALGANPVEGVQKLAEEVINT